jgi:type I restriction enzyme, S subunit
MNADRLLQHYERIADAPDAIARLRRFILNLAVRGKLLPQDTNDEPASELLKRIGCEKARLVNAGEIKREKPVESGSVDELAIDLPAGWSVACLSEIAVCLDYRRVPINGTERDARIEGKSQESLFPYFGATQQQGWIDDYLFDGEFVLLGEDGVPFHDPLRTKAYLISGKSWVNNHAHVFQGILTSTRFLVHYLNVFDYAGRVVGATRAKLNQAQAFTIPIPIPPLAEQHRIVAKVDELMGLCDQLEAACVRRESARDRLTAASLTRLSAPDPKTFLTDASFALDALPAFTTRPDQIKRLRQTILNLAVRGKLVPQDANDEPASVRRALDAPPYEGRLDADIPSNWRWVRVEDVADARLGKMLDKAKNKGRPYPYLRNTNVHWFDIRLDDLKNIPLDDAEFEEYRLRDGDVLICEGGHGIGRTAVWRGNTDNLVFQKALHRVRPSKYLKPDFFAQCCFVYFDEGIMQTYFTGVGIPHFTGRALSKLVFPLPPLAEQHRIVAKVDALMALCDRLEASLTATVATRRRLLDALLAEALAPVDVAELEAAD